MNVLISPYLANKNPNFKTEQAHVLDSLEMSSWSRGAHVEKLNAKSTEQAVYSIRLSLKSRLLFTRVGHGEGAHWLLLDELLHHEYGHSPFLKKSYLKQYLEKSWVKLSEAPSPTEEVAQDKANLIELEYFNQQYIVLNSEQEQTLYASMPLIVQGMPGSGKSCVALSMMRQLIENRTEESCRLLYVTKSQDLIKNMQKIWGQTPGFSEEAVDFIAYEDLFPKSELDQLLKGQELNTFRTWFASHAKAKHQLSQGLDRSVDLEALVYQEFRMMSAYDLKEYLQFSQRQCLFAREHYALLYDLFGAYCQHLEKNRLIDLSLVSFVKEGPYTHLFVDEAQDFSTRQLIELSRMTQNNQIVYFIDSNQSLNDNFSKLSCLKRLFGDHYKSLELPYSFRSSKAVIRLANDTLGLKYHLTGGVLEKDVATKITPSPESDDGAVIWTNQFSPEQKSNIEQSVRVAILCDREDIHKAEDEFPGALIMTVEQAKGLEYDIIIAYYLLERYVDNTMNNLAKQYQGHEKTVRRPKEGKAHHEYGPAINQLFTAFTRAKSAVYILHRKDTHGIKFVLNALKNKEAVNTVLDSLVGITKSTPEERLLEIKKQLSRGNQDVAERMRQPHRITQCVEDKKELGVDSKDSEPHSSQIEEVKANQQMRQIFQKVLQSVVCDASPATTYLQTKVSIQNKLVKLADCHVYPLFQEEMLAYLNTKGLFSLSTRDEGLKLLLILFKTQPYLIQGLKAQSMFEKKSGKNTLSLLVQTENGCKILATLLNKNDSMLCALSHEHLYQYHEQSTLPVFYWLAGSPLGVDIIDFLFEKKPNLLKKLTPDLLLAQRPIPTRGLEELSILFLLAESAKGLEILWKLFTHHKELPQKLTHKDLCQVRNDATDVCTNVSVLYMMASQLRGQMILSILFHKNEKLLLSLTGADFCRLRTKASGVDEHMSVLGILARTDKGCELMIQLMEHNSSIAEQITPEALYLTRNVVGEESQKTSTFYELITHLNGYYVLEFFFRNNKKLVDAMSAEILGCSLSVQNITKKNIPALYRLCAFDEGVDVLVCLLAHHPTLARDISGKSLCLNLPQDCGMLENTSPFYWLSSSSKGRNLLLVMFRNNQVLATDVTGQHLCLICNINPEHQRFIIHKYITAERIPFDIDKSASTSADTSILYFLSEEELGHEILTELFKQNPNLYKEIDFDALVRSVPKRNKQHSNQSVINFLCRSEIGKKILANILVENPDFIPKIKVKNWESIYKELCDKFPMLQAVESAKTKSLGFFALKKTHVLEEETKDLGPSV